MLEYIALKSGNETMVTSIAISPDGRFLAAGQQGINNSVPNLVVWDLKNYEIFDIIEHEDNFQVISGIAFIDDGKSIIYAKDNLNLWQYKFFTREKIELEIFSPYTKGIYSPDANRYLAVFGLQHQIYDWQLKDGIWSNDYNGLGNPNHQIPISIARNLEKFAYYNISEKKIMIASFADKIVYQEYSIDFEEIKSLTFSPDARYLAVVDLYQKNFAFIDTKTQSIVENTTFFGEPYLMHPTSISFHPNKNYFVTTGASDSLYVFGLDNLNLLKDFILGERIELTSKHIVCACFSFDGTQFFTGNYRGEVAVINTSSFAVDS